MKHVSCCLLREGDGPSENGADKIRTRCSRMILSVSSVLRALLSCALQLILLSSLSQGLVAVYLATAGSMMVFVYLVTLFGASGNWLRRTGRPVLKHLAAPLRYRSVVVAIACVAAVAAHVERFSSPPSFRPLTVHGKPLSNMTHGVVGRCWS